MQRTYPYYILGNQLEIFAMHGLAGASSILAVGAFLSLCQMQGNVIMLIALSSWIMT